MDLLPKTPIMIGNTLVSVADINANFVIKTSVKNMAIPMQSFRINPWDTPQSIAHIVYNDTRLHWLILLAADMTSEYKDWPKHNDDVQSYCDLVYEDGANGIHHYESIDGDIIDHYQQHRYKVGLDPVPMTVNVITNYTHELMINESKKIINIFSPASVSQILNKIEQALS